MRHVRSLAIMMIVLMALSSFVVALVPAGASVARTITSRVDTEDNNNEINGADQLTSGTPNPASLLISSNQDVQDWFWIGCNAGQVLNASLYHVDWDAADTGRYNLQLVVLGPEEEGSNNYVARWFSFLRTRWETGSTLCQWSAPYFVLVVVNSTNDNPPQVATDPTHYVLDVTVSDPQSINLGNSDQKTLSIDSSKWFHWYKIATNANQVFNCRLTNPNGGNIDMDMYGLWQRGTDSGSYQGYQPFFLNQTRNDATNGNAEAMQGLAGELEVYVRLWLREGSGLDQYTFAVQNGIVGSDGDNVPSDATLLEKTSSILAHGHQAVDHFDWYKFNIDAGFTVDITFSLQNVKSSYWNLTIWDSNVNYVDGWFNTQDGGAFRAPDQGAGDPGNVISSAGIFKQDWDPPSPGTYYISVMSIAGDPLTHMNEPPLADQYYRLYVGLPNFGPENKSQISNAVIDEDEVFSGLDLIDYFQDPEGDPLTFAVSDDSAQVSTKLTGSNVSATPAADWNGICNITVQATDGSANIGANTIEQTFKLTVNAVNDDPYVKTQPVNFTMFEAQKDWAMNPPTLPQVFGDIDSQLTYSYSGQSKIQVKMIQPEYRVYFSAPDLWFGQENITFTAKDEGTNVAKVTVNVRVNHKNHGPTLAFNKHTYKVDMDEDDEGNFDLNVADMFEDIDTTYAGDELFYRLKDPLPLHLNITILDDFTLSIIPEANWSGDAEFKVMCEDEFTAFNETTIQVTVTPVNDAPRIVAYTPTAAERTIDEDDSETFMISSVSDIDNDTKYDIRYNWYVDNVLQTDDNVKNHQFTFRTVFNEDDGFDEGTYHIKCVVTDGLENDEVEWTVIVNDVNQVPEGARIISPTATEKYKVGKAITFEADVNASDPDGDPLYYSWVHRGSNTSLSEDSAWTFDWKDKELKKVFKPGKHTIDLYVSDGRGGEIKTSVTITVKAAPGSGTPGFEALALLAAVAVVFLALRGRRRR